jgi:hypothetical protein
MVDTSLVLADAIGLSHALVRLLILAVVTSLPNASTAFRLTRQGRGDAAVSETLNSNNINLVGVPRRKRQRLPLRPLDREMARASTLELTDPPQAASLWATVDRRLVDEAAWVPFVNQRAVDFVSKRVRNYQYTPVGGFVAQEPGCARSESGDRAAERRPQRRRQTFERPRLSGTTRHR